MRKLATGLQARGHSVEVLTTSLVELEAAGARVTRREAVDGVRVHYLATPVRYRWMGIAPSAGRELAHLPRPDVVHIFGFRDFVGTVAARWARGAGVPYVVEGLGMVLPKLRKVRLKRFLDASIYRQVLSGAALLVAASPRERDEYLTVGADPLRISVRPNGFPAPLEPVERPGPLRRKLGLDAPAPLVLAAGRVARGKGLELLVRSLPGLDAHLAIVGPDDRHGMTSELLRIRDELALTDRVHLLGSWSDGELPLDVYADADVHALASAHENFGMVVAEAAAAGTASVVSDRCGVAEFVRDRAALVVPPSLGAIQAALRELLGDDELRARLGAGGRQLARELSWERVAGLQEELYERVA
jgi:glycosyltransferase involved in cell wall biosynthesis